MLHKGIVSAACWPMWHASVFSRRLTIWRLSAVTAHVARLLLLLSPGELLHCYAFQQQDAGREAHASYNALHSGDSLSLVKAATSGTQYKWLWRQHDM